MHELPIALGRRDRVITRIDLAEAIGVNRAEAPRNLDPIRQGRAHLEDVNPVVDAQVQ